MRQNLPKQLALPCIHPRHPAALLLAAFAALAWAAPAWSADVKQSPNIIFVLTDDKY